jgi:hypothetical protein
MAIRVKIGKAEDEGTTASQLAKTPDVKVRLDIRKTLDGNLIISDHPDITIVIIPTKRKILSLAKQLNSGVVYGAQNRLFDFLIDKGVVNPTSVEGGSIYASMEATIPEAPNIPAVKVAIINVARWLESEKPSIDFLDNYEDVFVLDLTDPDAVHSTELGQVPHAAEKGSIKPSLARGPYGLSMYNYYGY